MQKFTKCTIASKSYGYGGKQLYRKITYNRVFDTYEISACLLSGNHPQSQLLLCYEGWENNSNISIITVNNDDNPFWSRFLHE